MSKEAKPTLAREKLYTSLRQHKRHKKKLISPFNALPGLTHSSWVNDRLPDMLWAILLTEALPRDDYLSIFRQIISSARNFRGTKAFITHSQLERVSSRDFVQIFGPILSDRKSLNVLSPLLLFDELPDLRHWKARLPSPDQEQAWHALARAVAGTLDHQTESATDIRWLKVAFLGIQHRVRFPEKMAQQIAEMLNYPNAGDLRSVRPFIRSLEISVSQITSSPTSWPDHFWDFCYESTSCDLQDIEQPKIDFPYGESSQSFADTYLRLVEHFHETLLTTKIDPRHDGAFGLALYGLTLVASSFRPHSTRPAGRLLLRSLVEVYITLAYLLKQKSDELWLQYRQHGNGQSKLAFLKISDANGALPRYVNVRTLEALSNDDMWQEFIDIDVGHWAGLDLRRMSEAANVKDIYDKYYNWPSSFVHAQWGAVRNTVYDFCINPLHKLHRIPRPPRLDLEDVGWDCMILGNLILELLDSAYPTFEHRLIDPSMIPSAAVEDDGN